METKLHQSENYFCNCNDSARQDHEGFVQLLGLAHRLIQGAPIKNNPIGKIRYLLNCNIFFPKIYHVYRGGFTPYIRQISLQYFVAFKNCKYFLNAHFSKWTSSQIKKCHSFCGKNEWPPNSPDLKCVGPMLGHYQIWNDLPQEFIDKAILSFQQRFDFRVML